MSREPRRATTTRLMTSFTSVKLDVIAVLEAASHADPRNVRLFESNVEVAAEAVPREIKLVVLVPASRYSITRPLRVDVHLNHAGRSRKRLHRLTYNHTHADRLNRISVISSH